MAACERVVCQFEIGANAETGEDSKGWKARTGSRRVGRRHNCGCLCDRAVAAALFLLEDGYAQNDVCEGKESGDAEDKTLGRLKLRPPTTDHALRLRACNNVEKPLKVMIKQSAPAHYNRRVL